MQYISILEIVKVLINFFLHFFRLGVGPLGFGNLVCRAVLSEEKAQPSAILVSKKKVVRLPKNVKSIFRHFLVADMDRGYISTPLSFSGFFPFLLISGWNNLQVLKTSVHLLCVCVCNLKKISKRGQNSSNTGYVKAL